MKKKLDIRINPKKLTGGQIARHKDFDGLLKKVQAAAPESGPLFRRLVYRAVAVAAALAGIVFTVYYFAGNPNYEEGMARYFESKNYVNPPFSEVKPQFASYHVNSGEGGVFEYPSGSKLTIPAAAFITGNGQPLEGEVVLHYREMHDFVDFFLSGIPMSYDSAGVKYTLESAGMIEIFAEQNGKRVDMAPSKSIDIALVSQVDAPPTLTVPTGYNIYKLDESRRNWVYTAIDEMDFLDGPVGRALDETGPAYPAYKDFKSKMDVIQLNHENELARTEATLPRMKGPIKPQKANPANHVFDLDFKALSKSVNDTSSTKDEIAEMYRQYEKMLWQLSPKSKITPAQLEKEFGQVSGLGIKKLNSSEYELTLKKGDKATTIIANPVLAGTDYEQALATFDKEFAVWNKKMQEREAILKTEKDALQKRLAEEQRLAQLDFEKKLDELKKMGRADKATDEVIRQKVVNRFKATSFGIWNCDRPLPPMLANLKANFKNEDGHFYEYHTAYLVDKSRNTVVQFLAQKGAKFIFNRNSQNLLWLVTKDNKIAVCRPEDFKKIDEGASSYTFVFQKIDREINSENDVREILQL